MLDGGIALADVMEFSLFNASYPEEAIAFVVVNCGSLLSNLSGDVVCSPVVVSDVVNEHLLGLRRQGVQQV